MTTDIVNNKLKNIDASEKQDCKTLKTKDYILRAKRKYERKRYQEDPEFRKNKIEGSNEHKKKNIEKTREYYRKYMRKYRDKKKAEKVEKAVSETTTPSTDITDTIDAMNSLAIKN